MAEVHPYATPWEQANARRLEWLALGLITVGLIWRFSRYLLAFPIWGDEAMLLVNYFTRSYGDLFGPIDNCQIAPLLFHVMEITVLRWLGTSELAVRLPAFLACLANLALFWHLSRLLLPPLAHTFAVGIFAVSIWPATMGALVKPYAFDLFFSLTLLLPAAHWMLHPDRLRPLVLLVLVAPVAMLGSYPTVFVGGAVALVLLTTAWQRGDRRALQLVFLYGLLLGATFLLHYLFVAVRHLASPMVGGTTAIGMDTYWSNAFPPLNPLRFFPWLFLVHTGQVAAYPLGAAKGGSIVTAALGVIGLIWLWRHDRRWVVGVILTTFALGLFAGFLRKYPYLLSCRLSQHVAPFHCLAAGLGIAVLILRVHENRRARAVFGVATILALIGLGGTLRDFIRPYRSLNAWEARQQVEEMFARAGNDPVFVPHRPENVEVTLYWYLEQRRDQVHWNVNLKEMSAQSDSFWVFNVGDPGDESAALVAQLNANTHRWRCVERRPFMFGKEVKRDPLTHGRFLHLVREASTVARGESP